MNEISITISMMISGFRHRTTTTTVKTNLCPTGMGMNDLKKKGPPKPPGAYETGSLHLASEMLQVGTDSCSGQVE